MEDEDSSQVKIIALKKQLDDCRSELFEVYTQVLIPKCLFKAPIFFTGWQIIVTSCTFIQVWHI